MEATLSQPSLGNVTQSCSPQALPISSPVPLDYIESSYCTWLDSAPYNLFEKDGQPLLLKQSRRGNSPYVRKLDRSFDTFISSIPRVQFFNAPEKIAEWKLLYRSHQSSKFSCTTNMLYGVLTFDHTKVSRDDSWKQYKEINHFISHVVRVLSSHVGHPVRVNRFIVPEPHPHPSKPEYAGYAHINIVLLLSEPVQIFPHIKTDEYDNETITWRIKSHAGSHSKADIDFLNHIKAGFRLGNLDIQAISSIKKGYTQYHGKPVNNGVLDLKYLIKYLCKSVDSPAKRSYYPVTLTAYSMLTWTRSRTYSSLSMTFVEAVKQSCPLDLINNNDAGLTKTVYSFLTFSVPSKCRYIGHLTRPSDLTFPEWRDKLRPLVHSLNEDEEMRSWLTHHDPVVMSRLAAARAEDAELVLLSKASQAIQRANILSFRKSLRADLYSEFLVLQAINQSSDHDLFNLPCSLSDCSRCPNLNSSCPGKSDSSTPSLEKSHPA
jgi:hypothetical protein